jgi:outer membrane protein assembly factor BamB
VPCGNPTAPSSGASASTGISCPTPTSALAAGPDLFYVGLASSIVAVDPRDGSERFKIVTPLTERGGQIALVDGQLLRRTGLQSLEAYDPMTGQQRWSYAQPFERAGPSVGVLRSFDARDGLLVVYCACDTLRPNQNGWLLAVDVGSGLERWRAPLDAYFEQFRDQPVVGDGVVLTSVEGSDVVARDDRRRQTVALQVGTGAAHGDGRAAGLCVRPGATLAALATDG